MAFRIGQKVVCIVPKLGIHGPDTVEPDRGDIGTICNIYVAHDGDTMIELVEFPAPKSFGWYPGWYAADFRPLVEKKTDISIFTKMLNPDLLMTDK